MIERVAKAIAFEIERQLKLDENLDPTAIALVAVAASNRPSEEMLESGEVACWATPTCHWAGYLNAAWPVMIRRAVDGF